MVAIAGCSQRRPITVSREQATPLSKETVLKESYALWTATIKDTLVRKAAFAAAADSDTATWNETVRGWKLMRAFSSWTLGTLGYGTGPFHWNYGSREQGAISRFQSDLGIQVTGRLDSLTISHLLRARKALTLSEVELSALFVSQYSARGTWLATTNKLYYPVNSVEITWSGPRGECKITTLQYNTDDFQHVTTDQTTLPIVYWSPDLVVAREGTPNDGASLTVNIRAQEVVFVQTGRPEMMAAGDSPDMSLRLVNGLMLGPNFFDSKTRVAGDSVFADAARYIALRKKNFITD